MSQLVRIPDGMRYMDMLQDRIAALERQAAGVAMPVADQGVDLAKRNKINFVGAGVTAYDDPANARTEVYVPGVSAAYGIKVTGNGGTLEGTSAYLIPGMALSVATPANSCLALINGQMRIDCNQPVWLFSYVAVGISPTPPFKYHANAFAGGPSNSWYATQLIFLHSGGPTSAIVPFFDLAVLAANTTYTIQVYSNSAVGSGHYWANTIAGENGLAYALIPW